MTKHMYLISVLISKGTMATSMAFIILANDKSEAFRLSEDAARKDFPDWRIEQGSLQEFYQNDVVNMANSFLAVAPELSQAQGELKVDGSAISCANTKSGVQSSGTFATQDFTPTRQS